MVATLVFLAFFIFLMIFFLVMRYYRELTSKMKYWDDPEHDPWRPDQGQVFPSYHKLDWEPLLNDNALEKMSGGTCGRKSRVNSRACSRAGSRAVSRLAHAVHKLPSLEFKDVTFVIINMPCLKWNRQNISMETMPLTMQTLFWTKRAFKRQTRLYDNYDCKVHNHADWWDCTWDCKETQKTIEGLTDEKQTRIVKSRENTPGGQKPTLILYMALRAVCWSERKRRKVCSAGWFQGWRGMRFTFVMHRKRRMEHQLLVLLAIG